LGERAAGSSPYDARDLAGNAAAERPRRSESQYRAVKQIARVRALADYLFEHLRASNSIARLERRV
jgi:hypothetical protein